MGSILKIDPDWHQSPLDLMFAGFLTGAIFIQCSVLEGTPCRLSSKFSNERIRVYEDRQTGVSEHCWRGPLQQFLPIVVTEVTPIVFKPYLNILVFVYHVHYVFLGMSWAVYLLFIP